MDLVYDLPNTAEQRATTSSTTAWRTPPEGQDTHRRTLHAVASRLCHQNSRSRRQGKAPDKCGNRQQAQRIQKQLQDQNAVPDRPPQCLRAHHTRAARDLANHDCLRSRSTTGAARRSTPASHCELPTVHRRLAVQQRPVSASN